MISLVVYSIAWVLITLLVAAVTVIVFLGRRSDSCIRDPNLYCWPDWQCAGNSSSTLSGDRLAAYQAKCQLDANGNVPSTCTAVTLKSPNGST